MHQTHFSLMSSYVRSIHLTLIKNIVRTYDKKNLHGALHRKGWKAETVMSTKDPRGRNNLLVVSHRSTDMVEDKHVRYQMTHRWQTTCRMSQMILVGINGPANTYGVCQPITYCSMHMYTYSVSRQGKGKSTLWWYIDLGSWVTTWWASRMVPDFT